MKPSKNINKKDFLLLFEEVRNFHKKDSSIIENLKSEDELIMDESIKEFGEICSEMNLSENEAVVFFTFL